jgi:hypothetical protein
MASDEQRREFAAPRVFLVPLSFREQAVGQTASLEFSFIFFLA